MQSGVISDGQISASSQWGDNYAASRGRLQLSGRPWSVATNNVSQWLQVDLIGQYTNVTRVATQGSNAYDERVTEYKLQYSNDGVNFQNYTEQRQNTDRVSLLTCIKRTPSGNLHCIWRG